MAQQSTPPADETAAGFALLARVVRARRKRLGLTQRTVRDHNGPTFGAIQAIENETANPTNLTFAKLDRGLSWPIGTAYCLVHAQVPEAQADWNSFVSISINDTSSPDGDTIQARLHRNHLASMSDEIETLNHYLLFADYSLAEAQNTYITGSEEQHARHVATLRDCIHEARYIVLGWIRQQNKDTN